ncbi:nuclear transport factor 2 family protein [Halobacillus sp. A5]|uniref:nuclear transport factor 2 family protein n=1 Tax=Halobacillus sp. A5 TaxID=2880263 RepID=UPI0020A688CD|nr:nuclear transport factor 2 family protein [Halobacillus sp. A5]MCP3026500.1 nuclear transport factor 2 family protein [Halobacillus sp. A5]
MTQKAELLKAFNEAFIKGDIDFVFESVTDNIAWEMVGADVIEGKENFAEALKQMKNDF